MYLTDEQIMLLEQLTYLTDDVADAAGVLLGPYDSVENLLQQFDDDALQRLEDPGNPDSTKDYTGGKKWAAIIRQIKSDPDLYSLDIVNKDDSVPAICFNDPDDPEHAVVVFRGTSGKDEWIDNAIGLGVSDTERQKAALDYIENLPYDSITVAGHSKGGNKAQYVTVLSDKVDRCISMDGQGFSQEFIDKYYAEIQKKGHCIKNYYLEGDFVSILMFPVPGSDQICIDGDDSVIGAENHAASSFYQFWQDEEGRWHIRCDADGNTALIPGTREDSMVYLHEFTTFIINVMPEDERERAGDYIGHILALVFVPDAHFDVDGNFAMSDVERRQLIEALIAEIQIYEERKPNGQWLKSIRFKLPIIENDLSIGLDNGNQVETVVLLAHKSPDSVINVKVEFGEGDDKISLDAIAERAKKYQPKPKITYKMIQEYVEKKYGFKVHTAYIAEVKRSLGVSMYDAPNAAEELKQPRKHPPKEKAEAIEEALKHFEVI